jgi:hypothetical protein
MKRDLAGAAKSEQPLELHMYYMYPSYFRELSSTLRQRPSINENSAIKSKITTPKGPKAFRRDPNLRCAMKVGSLELGTL